MIIIITMMMMMMVTMMMMTTTTTMSFDKSITFYLEQYSLSFHLLRILVYKHTCMIQQCWYK